MPDTSGRSTAVNDQSSINNDSLGVPPTYYWSQIILKLPHFAVVCSSALLLNCASLCLAQNPLLAQTSSTDSPTQTLAADQTANQNAVQNPEKNNDSRNKKDIPDAPSATAQAANSSGTSSGTSKDRLFYALPNFLTLENAGEVPPLTAKQKFKVVAQGSFDPVQIVWYGFLSGISQAENSEPGYGQGAEGYGKRYGAYAADGTIENFFVGAILPSIFRQDPRYFQSGQGTFRQRTEYSVSRIFVTRADSGKNEFNASEIFGSAIAAGISTYSYHPKSDRTVPNTFSVWGSQVGYDTITLVVKEFWPDIRRKIRKQPPAQAH